MALSEINTMLVPFMALVCLGIGFSAIGVDIVKTFHLNPVRKLIKCAAGIAGALALAQCCMNHL